MDFNKIKSLAKKRKITLKELAVKIDLTEQGLHYTFNNSALKVVDLEKIATILEVPISYFFGESETNNNTQTNLSLTNSVLNNNGTIHHYSNVAEAEREIDALRKEIVYLKEINQLLKEKK